MSDISRQLYQWEKEGIAMYEKAIGVRTQHEKEVEREAVEILNRGNMKMEAQEGDGFDEEEIMNAVAIRKQVDTVNAVNGELWELMR